MGFKLFFRVIIYLGLLCCQERAYAYQQEIDTLKRTYRTENDKLYWQGDLPIYLSISSEPDGMDAVRLKSEKTKPYADPMYLDAEGLNYFRSNYGVDTSTLIADPKKVEIKFEIYKDSKAPVTKINFKNAKRHKFNGYVYYGRGLEISLNAYDQGAGVGDIMVSQGNGFTASRDKIFPDKIGTNQIKYFAVDKVGNKEGIRTYTYEYDTIVPSTEITIKGDQERNVLSPRSTIFLAANDLGAGIDEINYQIDDNHALNYYDSIPLSKLEDGEHELIYRAVDKVENEEIYKRYEFYLDKEPPQVKASVIGEQYQNRGRVFVSTRSKVKLQATDNKSGLKKILYAIDDGPQRVYYEPFKLPKGKGNRLINTML